MAARGPTPFKSCQPREAEKSLDIRPLIGTTSARGLAVTQNRAQASISWRRFWNRSPRRYAVSTLFSIVRAKAISITSRGKFVHSAAQSRKVKRNPLSGEFVPTHPLD